jgi:hypothetical protein
MVSWLLVFTAQIHDGLRLSRRRIRGSGVQS